MKKVKEIENIELLESYKPIGIKLAGFDRVLCYECGIYVYKEDTAKCKCGKAISKVYNVSRYMSTVSNIQKSFVVEKKGNIVEFNIKSIELYLKNYNGAVIVREKTDHYFNYFIDTDTTDIGDRSRIFPGVTVEQVEKATNELETMLPNLRENKKIALDLFKNKGLTLNGIHEGLLLILGMHSLLNQGWKKENFDFLSDGGLRVILGINNKVFTKLYNTPEDKKTEDKIIRTVAGVFDIDIKYVKEVLENLPNYRHRWITTDTLLGNLSNAIKEANQFKSAEVKKFFIQTLIQQALSEESRFGPYELTAVKIREYKKTLDNNFLKEEYLQEFFKDYHTSFETVKFSKKIDYLKTKGMVDLLNIRDKNFNLIKKQESLINDFPNERVEVFLNLIEDDPIAAIQMMGTKRKLSVKERKEFQSKDLL